MQLPESIPKFQIHTVRFSMDIIESRQRPRLKRSMTIPVETYAKLWQHSHNPDVSLHDTKPTAITSNLGSAVIESPVGTPPPNRKRKRAENQVPTRTSSSPILSSSHRSRIRKCSSSISDLRPTTQEMSLTEELAEVFLMVDGAMQLSVYGHNRSPTGLKVKANTFGVGLADVAPALWRPGYLIVRQASQVR